MDAKIDQTHTHQLIINDCIPQACSRLWKKCVFENGGQHHTRQLGSTSHSDTLDIKDVDLTPFQARARGELGERAAKSVLRTNKRKNRGGEEIAERIESRGGNCALHGPFEEAAEINIGSRAEISDLVEALQRIGAVT